jgi:hypothetical protein
MNLNRVHESSSPATETNAKEVEMKEMPREDSTPKVQIQCEKKKPRLFWAIMKTFWFKSFIAAVYKLIFDVLQFVSPLILK